jgi:hypothetical protein
MVNEVMCELEVQTVRPCKPYIRGTSQRALNDVNLPKEVELVVEKWPGLINSGRGEVLAFGRGCLPRIPIFGVFS